MCLAVAGPLVAEEHGQWETTAPTQKVFKAITEFRYREHHYQPNTIIKEVTTPIMGNQGPDRELTGLVSAMRAQNFEWWLSIWDEATQQAWIQKQQSDPHFVTDLMKDWVDNLSGKDVRLHRWSDTSRFVIVTYKLMDKKNKKESGVENGVVFVLEKGRWRATMKFADDPEVKGILQQKSRFEHVVR